jgi:hypothetical protein
MPAPENDHLIFKAGVSELQDFLLSDQLFWQLAGVNEFTPSLSLGLLLLTRKRLEICTNKFADLTSLMGGMESIHGRWLSAWESKACLEINTRLNLWRNYLLDLQEHPGTFVDQYSHEVRNRAILQLLLAEVKPFSIPDSLIEMDALLRKYWQSGGFIWEREQSTSFPVQEYWFLYGQLSI